MSGILIGFLFGIPRAVSSGELRRSTDARNDAFTLSPNLAEVSDWLTKLLLGAGLVSLTRLGGPAGRLIDAVASGLQSAGNVPSSRVASSARVVAGTILVAYAILGFLEGYVITTVWYQKKLNDTRLNSGA